MATEHPTGKPYAFIGPASSPSGEDSSSSASGEDEAEQPPTANPTVPSPAGQFSTSEEDASDDDDEHEAELLPTKNPSIPATVGSFSTSEEDSSSSCDEHEEAEQRRTTNRYILAPARQGGDNEDDGGEGEPVGSSSVAAKRGPSPPPHLQGVPKPLTSPKGNVPSPKLTKPSPMKRTAAAAELGEPSLSKKKKKALANVPSKSTPPEPSPPSKAAAAVAGQAAGKEAAYNAEKRLEEKRETYWYLAETLNVLEKKQNVPGLYYATFLNIDDGKAAALDAKIKKQRMAEATLFLKRGDIEREVIKTLTKLIK